MDQGKTSSSLFLFCLLGRVYYWVRTFVTKGHKSKEAFRLNAKLNWQRPNFQTHLQIQSYNNFTIRRSTHNYCITCKSYLDSDVTNEYLDHTTKHSIQSILESKISRNAKFAAFWCGFFWTKNRFKYMMKLKKLGP